MSEYLTSDQIHKISCRIVDELEDSDADMSRAEVELVLSAAHALAVQHTVLRHVYTTLKQQ